MAEPVTETDYVWRLTKALGSSSAQLELGSAYEDLPDAALNLVIHSIGENLIKAGTQLLQSRLDDDADDEDDWDDA